MEKFIEKKFKGLVYTKMEMDKDLKCTYSYSSYEDRETYGINKSVSLPKAASFLKNVEGVDWAFFVKEKSNHYYTISFRAQNSNVDVSKIAEKLNGGGHPQASGAVVQGPLDILEVVERVLNTARDVLLNSA
jgi:phosphoesterase RecJ-like protein